MEVAPLLAAFAFGFVASRVGLPPLVGYLVAGYVLAVFGVESNSLAETVGDLGVLLLLFGIGLKLRLRTFEKPYVWGTATIFAIVGTLLPAAVLLAARATGLLGQNVLDLREALIVGLAFSFSSTVFAIKALERTRDGDSIGGRIAIGILILQDLVAVGFLVLTSETAPSLWAILVIPGLAIVRPVFGWILDRVGHGELLVLYGFTLAVGVGAASFELVGLKPDLGALLVGFALAGHPRASEVSDRILGIKDLLLVGFFLSIGLSGLPTVDGLLVGLVVLALLPTRSIALLLLLTRFRLRSRTALQTSLTLSAYSEFGLVVAIAATTAGVLDADWVPTIGVAVAASFIVAALGNTLRYRIYDRWFPLLRRLDRHRIIPEDAVIEFDGARVLIFGMGRVGTGAYDELVQKRDDGVVGVDRDQDLVDRHVAAGRHVTETKIQISSECMNVCRKSALLTGILCNACFVPRCCSAAASPAPIPHHPTA
jgi:predicted Kef-type K+ transport protein